MAAAVVAALTGPTKADITRLDDKVQPLEIWKQTFENGKWLEQQTNENTIKRWVDEALRADHGKTESQSKSLEPPPLAREPVSILSMDDLKKLIDDVNELKRSRPVNFKTQIDELRQSVERLESSRIERSSEPDEALDVAARFEGFGRELAELKKRVEGLDKAHREAMEHLEGGLTYQVSLVAQPQEAFRSCRPPNTSRANSFRLPRALSPYPKAIYPPDFEKRNLTAEVMLCLTIGTDGSVTNVVDVTQPKVHSLFVDEAVKAAKKRRYAPGLLDGQPTEWRVIAGVPFG